MIDVNVNVPGLEKLLDYAASGIGAVAGPMLAPWKASREAKAKLIGATANSDSLRLIAEAQADARRSLVSPSEVTQGTFLIDSDYVKQHVEFQQTKRLQNIASAVNDAAAELDGKQVPDHEPDHDWTARYFEGVQDVSSEDVRKIWARILAGEVEHPGGVSFRTLSILKNMSHQEATLFAEAMRYRIDDYIFEKYCLASSKILNSQHLTFTFENIGLFYSPIGVRPGRTFRLGKDGTAIMLNCNNVLFLEGIPGNSIDLDDKVILKEPALELARFCDAEADFSYLGRISKHLSTKQCTLKWAPISDDRVSYSPSDLRLIVPTP